MVEKDYKHLVGGIKRVSLTLSPSAANPLYGTKILNLKTQEIGLLICLWENKFADKTVDCLIISDISQYIQCNKFSCFVTIFKKSLKILPKSAVNTWCKMVYNFLRNNQITN